MSNSEYTANLELTKMCKENGYAQYAFNVSGDVARRALHQHNKKHGKGLAKAKAVFLSFFIG